MEYKKRLWSSKNINSDPWIQSNFGFKTYRGSGQKLAVRSILHMPEEENVLVILPTGEGKSLLYQSMALYKPNHTIPVVVPTVSLAQDQEISLEENRKLYNINKKHAYVGGNKDVNNSILDLISSGNQGLLFSNPESFVTSLKV